MTYSNGKNLFGMTVTAKDGKVITCAHLEPIAKFLPNDPDFYTDHDLKGTNYDVTDVTYYVA